MKRILSAALACAVLLAGCAAPASTSGAPGGTSAGSAPEPTPAPTPSPAPKEVSLEEWRAAMPANAPSFSHESIDLTLDEQVLWPEQVELLIWAWEGTLEEADAAFGLPAGSFSLWEDTYYPPPEGAIAIRAEGYVLPKVPMERVTVDVPWLMYDFGRPNQYDLPADLDEQALCALAAAHYFLYNFNGMHHGFDPCEFDQETYCSTATEGALYTRYSDLVQFFDCVFTPDNYAGMLGGPLAAGETPDSGLFYQGEGDSICFLAGDRGGNIAYCGTVYSEPALQPDGSLLFWQFSLYLDEDDENFVGWGPGNKYTPVEARATPVRLVPSDNGWRVAEYSLPN